MLDRFKPAGSLPFRLCRKCKPAELAGLQPSIAAAARHLHSIPVRRYGACLVTEPGCGIVAYAYWLDVVLVEGSPTRSMDGCIGALQVVEWGSRERVELGSGEVVEVGQLGSCGIGNWEVGKFGQLRKLWIWKICKWKVGKMWKVRNWELGRCGVEMLGG